MSFAIDIILLAVIIITALISAKYGFVRTLIEFVGFILIIMISTSVSVPIAEAIYDNKIQKDVIKVAESENSTFSLPAEDFINSLPGYLTKDSGLLRIDKNKLIDSYNNNIKSSGDKIAQKISDDVIRPAAIKIMSVIISAIILAVLSVAVHIIARVANTAVKNSFARGLNEKIGFIIGIPKGILISFILCIILIVYFNTVKNGFGLLTSNDVNNSYCVRFVRFILPDYGIFSYII